MHMIVFFFYSGSSSSNKEFIKYTSSTLQGSDITPILFLHNLQTFTSTSDTVQRITDGHSQGDCLMRCWETSTCFAAQVVYEGSGTNDVEWCVLVAVGESALRVLERSGSVGVNTTFTHLDQWTDPIASGHSYLTTANLQAAETTKPMAVFVKSKYFKHLFLVIPFKATFSR